jgi:hypothetical protein
MQLPLLVIKPLKSLVGQVLRSAECKDEEIKVAELQTNWVNLG